MAMPTPRRPISRTVGGITFEDPYAWLEEDTPEVLAWQAEQTARTVEDLRAWPHLDRLRELVTPYVGRQFVFAPLHRGKHWFRMGFNDRGATLEVSAGPAESGSVLINPAALAGDDRPVSLDWFYPSPDGGHVAFGVSFAGDEQSVLHVIETETGKVLPERIHFTSVATVSWMPDGKGFFYSGGHAPDWVDADKQLFFHRLGDTQVGEPEDITVREAYCVFPQVSPNGHWLAAVTSEMDPRPDFIRELPDGRWRKFLLDVKGRGHGVFAGDTYIAIITEGAPRGRLVAVPVETSDDRSTWKVLIPEGDGVVLSVELVGDRLVVTELVDTYARLKVLDLEGRVEDVVELPGRGTVLQLAASGHYLTASPWMGMNVSPGVDEFTFVFSTFTRSPALYLYDLRMRRLTELSMPEVANGHIAVHDRTATASDGATVRYSVIHRSDLDTTSRQPTLIYGYGGWNISFIPSYLGIFTPFVEAGGVFVFAHLRGGGELGEDFWRDGRLANKQHTYDDLYAVAEDLVRRGTTDNGRLGVVGASNGGLLTGVAVTQRPDLWRAVCSMVPLYDMLAFTRDSYTATCVLEYGDPQDPDDAKVLYRYSPYHNVREQTSYPATLIYCGAGDMRCLPWQSRKLAARLQAANRSEHPILLRVVEQGGHLTVMNEPAQIAEWLGFLMRELGLEPS
jgi:prolyl oligopeptidase